MRARATCVENGVTRSGQSDFFTIPASGSIDVPDIILGPVTPVPTRLTVSAATTTLTAPNQAIQLTVTGTYADGSTADLSANQPATQYLSSNSELASVTSNGLVIALRSGTVLVQASHEGAQGLLQLNVALSVDSDGDGILDDIELAAGMDPNDPTDALEDFDRDGLTNGEEILLGTNIQDPDTDGDGIADGEEVTPGQDGFVTSPVLVDTDGDGVPDGIEIATSSDPTDAQSTNLAQALSGITVTPPSFAITVNSIDGVGFRDLTVTGAFKLGGTIDLTSRARGTQYQSGDLQVCNFGAEDGRVYGSQDGQCAITVSNSGFTVVATGVVKNFQPRALSAITIPGYANNVDVAGNFAYVAAGSGGLQILNVADPLNPQIIKAVALSGNANDVRVVGSLAFVAVGFSGLQVVDVTDPVSATILGSVETPGEASDVMVFGTLAYVADGDAGLAIINVANPAAPTLITQVDTPGYSRGVDVLDINNGARFAIVADDVPAPALRVIDVTAPASAARVADISVGGQPTDVRVSGSNAYVAAFNGGLQIADLSNPLSPSLSGSLPSSQLLPRDVAVAGNWAILAEVLFPNAVPLVEISSPSSPIRRSVIDFFAFGDYNGTGIAVHGPNVYMTGSTRFDIENGTQGSSRLFIGEYLPPDGEGIAPQVSLTSPQTGSSVVRGSALYLRAEASDDVGVDGVDFFVNGVLQLTDGSPPYEALFRVPDNATALTVQARARDLAGAIGVSEVVSLTAIPDPLTTARGRVTLGSAGASGANVTCQNQAATTDSNGNFSVTGLVTIAGDIFCQATYSAGGNAFAGSSATKMPVLGSITPLGDVVLSAAVYNLPVDPKGAWIFRDTDPNGGGGDFVDANGVVVRIPDANIPATRVTFAELETVLGTTIVAGMNLILTPKGDVSFCTTGFCIPPFPEVRAQVLARFVGENGNTVPFTGRTVMQSTAVEFATQPTCARALPTDELGDFMVSPGDIELLIDTLVEVPVGAVAMEFSANDCFYNDNADPDGDYRVSIRLASDITTVTGRVLWDADSQPVAGANVTCGYNSNVSTGSDGRFVLRGYPVPEGAVIFCQASFVDGGKLFRGFSNSGLPPVLQGESSIGDIRLQDGAAPVAEFALTPTGTWFAVAPDDVASPPTRVDLQDLGNLLGVPLQPGAVIAMSPAGGLTYCPAFGCPDGLAFIVGRFVDANGNTIAPLIGDESYPIEFLSEWDSGYTCQNGIQTFEPDAFLVFKWAGDLAAVGIPGSAVALEFTPADCYRSDTEDPNGDLRMWIGFPGLPPLPVP